MNDVDSRIAWAQIWLAFFYGASFLGIFIFMAIFWSALSKFDVGLLSMFATAAMNQSKDASTFFFARHRASSAADGGSGNGGGDPAAPLVPSPPAKT